MDLSKIDKSRSKTSDKLSPKGFSLAKNETKKAVRKIDDEMITKLKVKKAYDIAMGGAKSIPMNLFMLYMSGNSIQIFSIIITVMLLWNSLNGVLNTLQIFQPFLPTKEAQETKGQKIMAILNSNLLPAVGLYILLQLVNFGLGVWKMGGMGLLPTSTSDWLAFEQPKVYAETVAGPI